MKKKILYLLILIYTIGCAKSRIIPQAEPFENIIISVKKSSESLFKNSFSERIHNEKADSLTWFERLKVAEERLGLVFGKLNTNDFSYEFDGKESTLIVKHKTEESFRMKVVMESGDWKLDEH